MLNVGSSDHVFVRTSSKPPCDPQDIGGRLLRRPQRNHPAATMADILTGILTFIAPREIDDLIRALDKRMIQTQS
jgi:hypothetical protein